MMTSSVKAAGNQPDLKNKNDIQSYLNILIFASILYIEIPPYFEYDRELLNSDLLI